MQSCYIFNANISDNVAPVFIEDNDRRYTIITNDNAKNLREIWTDNDYENWEKGIYKKQLMKWIYNLPKDYSIDVKKGIDNASKQAVINLGKNNIELALEDLAATFTGWLSTGDLIDVVYRQYGIRSTARANGNILRKLGFNSVVRNVDGHNSRGYLFNMPDSALEEKDIIDNFLGE